MCLTIPGRIVRIEDRDGSGATATIEYPGATRTANLVFLPDAKLGDYVLVQSGFATTRLEENDALEALACAQELDEFRRAPGTTPSAGATERNAAKR
jgi:hydrogenase expression/formation protein HypC